MARNLEAIVHKARLSFRCDWPIGRAQDHGRHCVMELTLYTDCQDRIDYDAWLRCLDGSLTLCHGHKPCTVADTPCLCTRNIFDHLVGVHGVDFRATRPAEHQWTCEWGACLDYKCNFTSPDYVKLCQHILAAHISRQA